MYTFLYLRMESALQMQITAIRLSSMNVIYVIATILMKIGIMMIIINNSNNNNNNNINNNNINNINNSSSNTNNNKNYLNVNNIKKQYIILHNIS